MKKLILPLLLATMISSQAYAQVALAISSGAAASTALEGSAFTTDASNPQLASTLKTLAPIIAIVISVAGSSVIKKEEMAVVKNDSVLFIAGFEKSELLEDLIKKLKESSKEVSQLDEHTIALALALGLK